MSTSAARMAKLRERQKRDEVCLLVCLPRVATIEALKLEEISAAFFADSDDTNQALTHAVQEAIQSIRRKHGL